MKKQNQSLKEETKANREKLEQFEFQMTSDRRKNEGHIQELNELKRDAMKAKSDLDCEKRGHEKTYKQFERTKNENERLKALVEKTQRCAENAKRLENENISLKQQVSDMVKEETATRSETKEVKIDFQSREKELLDEIEGLKRQYTYKLEKQRAQINTKNCNIDQMKDHLKQMEMESARNKAKAKELDIANDELKKKNQALAQEEAVLRDENQKVVQNRQQTIQSYQKQVDDLKGRIIALEIENKSLVSRHQRNTLPEDDEIDNLRRELDDTKTR